MRKYQLLLTLGLFIPLFVFTNMSPVDAELQKYFASSKRFDLAIKTWNCQAAVRQVIGLDEFGSKSAAGTPAEFVQRLYRGILAREPDSGGLNAWVSAISVNQMARRRVALQFVNSEEFHGRICLDLNGMARKEQEAYASSLYSQLLLRAPSAAEISAFIARLTEATDSTKNSLVILEANKRRVDAAIAIRLKLTSCSDLLTKIPSLLTGHYPVYPTSADREPQLAKCDVVNGSLSNSKVIGIGNDDAPNNCATKGNCLASASFFQTVTCKSTSKDYQDCAVKGQVAAPPYLVTKISGACDPAKDFGFNDSSIWTRNGCQGVFRVRVNAIRSQEEIFRAQIRELYLTLLKREPDQGGWDAWTANMKKGMTIEQVRAYFLSSPEYRGLQQSAKLNASAAKRTSSKGKSSN